MSNEPTNTPEVKEESETTVNEVATPEAEVKSETEEPTLADLHKEDEPEKKVPDSVPLARLNKEVSRRKELEKELAELRQQIDAGDDYDEPEDSSEVQKLVADVKEIKQREARLKAEQVFAKNLERTLENNPQYKDIVNNEVIKQMAFNPANKDKTYTQLLEEAYGNAIQGRRTMESTTPRGGAENPKVDIQRAQRDAEYRKQVLADPDMRKEYNKDLHLRIGV
jgi:ribosomal protein L29